jgi:hypothetical protein
VRTAHGTAVHLPAALEGLLSPDPTTREKSYWSLDNNVVLQADLHEAAYFVIPFLLEALRIRVPFGRDRIYDLLFEIGNGYAPDDVTCTTLDGNIVPLRLACHSAVRSGREIFQRDLEDTDPIIRSRAAELLESFQGA